MSYGMMNEAYFVGKSILLDWINNFLGININKVETCANGAIYCNLFDAIQPGLIPMKRVDFNVKQEFEYIKNWKLLQTAFQKAGIEKFIPVQRLIKARYQDNLEFMQWMYKYCRDNYPGDPDNPDYDALGARSKSRGGRDYTGGSRARKTTTRPQYGRRNKENVSANRPISANQRKARPNISSRTQQRARPASNDDTAKLTAEIEQLRSEKQRLTNTVNENQAEFEKLNREREELSEVAKDIEKERDFYFNKVLAVENLCKQQADQAVPLLTTIYDILYQTEEDSQNAIGANASDQAQANENTDSGVPAVGQDVNIDQDQAQNSIA